MTESQRIETTALNSQIFALKRIIYCVDKPFRQEAFDSYHKYVQKYINQRQANRYSEYEWCLAKLKGVLAALDYRVAWGKTVGTNAGVLIKDGIIVGLSNWSALRTTNLPGTYANAVITLPGSKDYLPVGLRNVESVYADPNEPFKIFPIPDGRLPRELAADILDLDPEDDNEDLTAMTLVITASEVLSPADQIKLFQEIDRLRKLLLEEEG
ncbi:hypothetical protein LCGC14_1578240 [marine sediment metagenome]|uniref:Uncharacterized protein n=1 Tax=marine sediment metagenome TaxID=412755 RepID=A0A0F9J3T8_9ZZZZ